MCLPFWYICYDYEALLTVGQLRSIIHHHLSFSVYAFGLQFIHWRSWSIQKGHVGVTALGNITDYVFCYNFCRLRHFMWNSLLSQIMLNQIVLPFSPLLFFTEKVSAALCIKDFALPGNRWLEIRPSFRISRLRLVGWGFPNFLGVRQDNWWLQSDRSHLHPDSYLIVMHYDLSVMSEVQRRFCSWNRVDTWLQPGFDTPWLPGRHGAYKFS
jgi:hypothetical protein